MGTAPFTAPLRVLHEDENLLAVDKPSGQAVIPERADGRALTLDRQAALHTGKKIYIVHRLDRETSGVVLFAKNAEIHRFLNIQFENRKVQKVYLALVQGSLNPEKGEIREPLRAFGSGRVAVDPRGKPSVTRYRVRERFSQSTLLEAEPLSGRRHQIRVHLYSLGHPVLGDARYGEKRPVGKYPRLMLHAWQISFTDPRLGLRRFSAEPPDDFLKALETERAAS
jgi:RluA family pseudouridine synthase